MKSNASFMSGLSALFGIFVGASFCFGVAGCAPKKPLAVLATPEQTELLELREENRTLKAELGELTKNCSAVLRVFKEAGRMGRAPEARQK